MTWAPITMRWPEQSTQWLSDLEAAKDLASSELASTGQRLEGLADLATTSPGPVGAAADAAVAAGRAGLADALGEVPACLVVTPFQSGVGQGRGHQRYLSAPNLLQQLGEKLEDTGDDGRPDGSQYALAVMFLSTRYDRFAATLARFNAVLPMPDLQRAERRAKNLSALDAEKWELPTAGTLPRWGALPLERCTVTKSAKQALNGQLSALESYADSSPMADLGRLTARKADQAQTQAKKLADLKSQFASGTADDTMRARLIGPGNAAELRHQLLQGEAPGHEWGLSAGLLLVGSLKGLGFVRELVGL
ncbi:hypothetical protein [Pseudomonas frederiksbergensis]|uniref:hypothetical protein n=1 Tax=Pseudomonas frederiksbergensis TaxID=104087 RepID=UPI003D1C1705